MSLPAEENSTQSEAATRRLSSDALRRSAMENGTIRSESMNQTSAVEDAATLVASEEKAKTNGRTIGMILLSVVVVLVVGFIFHSPQTNPTSFQAALHETDRALVSNDGACSEDSDCNSNLCIAGTCKKTFNLANPRTGKGLGMTGICQQDVQTHAWDYNPSFGGQTYFEHEGRVHPAKCKLLLALEVSSANGPWCNSAGNIILSEPNDSENQKLKIDSSGMLVPYGTTDIDGQQVCQSAVSIADQSHSNGAKIVLSPKDPTIADYQVFKIVEQMPDGLDGSSCIVDFHCNSNLCIAGTCKKTFILANPRTGKGLGMTGVCEQDVQTHAWDYDPSFGGQTYFEHEGRVHPAKCKLLLALEVSSANGPWCNSAGNIILSEPNDNENQKLKIDCSGMLVSYGTTDIDGQVCQSVVSIAGQSHSNGAKIVLSPKDRTIMDYQVFLVGSEVGSTCSQDLNCASTLCHDGVCAN